MIYNEDCLEGMKRLESGSVDFVLTDLPYNTTGCAWDKSVIDLAAMWTQFKRILKPYAAVALFASGKFTHKLIASKFDQFKYKWIWIKNAPTMFVHAKNAPMRKYEEIVIFSEGVINHKTCSKKRMPYNPQGLVDCGEEVKYAAHTSKVSLQGGKLKSGKNATKTQIHNPHPENTYVQTATNYPSHVDFYVQEQTGYPSDVLNFNVEPSNKKLHPTQKPVDLLEYLIRTYTNEGEVVLDATMGSGSTGVAAVNTGRQFIGFELDEHFFNVAEQRIAEAVAKREQSLF